MISITISEPLAQAVISQAKVCHRKTGKKSCMQKN